MWKKVVKEGRLDPEKIYLIKWDFQHPVVPTKYLSIEEVGRLGSWCMREFFSKPYRIHRIMASRYSDLAKLCVKLRLLVLQEHKRILRLLDYRPR